jgi:uncharacterized membrane protein HdeD (DUF308 family)
MENVNVKTSGKWSNILINGIVTLTIGLLLVFAPQTVYKMIVIGIGVALFLGGLISLIYVSRTQSLTIRNKSFWYIQAVINIVIGIFIFFQPELVLKLLRYFISIWLIIVGAIQLFYSAGQSKIFGNVSIMLINSILALLVGLIFLVWPEFPLMLIGYISIFISIILFYYAIVFYTNRSGVISKNISDIEDADIIEETKE